MKRFCYTFLLIALCAGSFNVQAASRSFYKKQCDKEFAKNPPEILLTYNYGQLSIDTSKSASELTETFKQLHPDINYDGTVNGLTSGDAYMQISNDVVAKEMANGEICYYPSVVKISVGYESPTIYLAKELQPGTCQYRVVLRHEQTHLDFNHRALDLLTLSLNNKAREIISEEGAHLSHEDEEAEKNNFVTAYKNQFSYIFELFQKTGIVQNGRLDNTDNYTYETKLCK